MSAKLVRPIEDVLLGIVSVLFVIVRAEDGGEGSAEARKAEVALPGKQRKKKRKRKERSKQRKEEEWGRE